MIKRKARGTLGALDQRAKAHHAASRQRTTNRYKLTEGQKQAVKKAVRQVKNSVVINPDKPEPTGY